MAAQSIPPTLKLTLIHYGLGSLINWATNALVKGLSEAEIMLQLKATPQFHARFPAIKWRENDGRPPISVDEYLEYEKRARELSDTYGMVLDKKETDSLISNNVSAAELQERFNIAAAASAAPSETKAELQRLYGVSSSQLMRFWMNPKAELPKLQQQFRSGQIAGAALRSGYGRITAKQAERLESAGMDENAAIEGFGQLDDMAELFSPLDEVEGLIDEDMQIEMLAGNADVRQQVEKRAGRRQAEFAGGGAFAEGEEGFATGSAD